MELFPLGHLKDLEISKYKRKSKARMPIKFCCLIFASCGFFSFLNIKKVKIYNENAVADGNVLCKNLQLECILHYLSMMMSALY